MVEKIRNIITLNLKRYLYVVAWISLCYSTVIAQNINTNQKDNLNLLIHKEEKKEHNHKDTLNDNRTLIYLEHTDLISFDNDVRPDIQVLKGNVIFRHDSVFLYCDSAYMNQKLNSFDAFGNVKIVQGDSINIFSRKLNYNGNTKIAKLFEDVKMVNDDVTLYTDTLTYDRTINWAYYICGGTIKDSTNTLVSKHGYYNANTKLAEFKWNVVGYNSSAKIESDTLTYNADSNIATILGPTTITHSDSTIVNTELGWYDSNTDKSQLLKESIIHHQNSKSLEGDTIFYDKRAGIGKAYSNVILTDSTNYIALLGNYGYYIEEGEIGVMTDSAMMMEYSQKDTIFVHSDTLYSFAVNDTNKTVLAYNNVRVFQNNYQGVCDSLVFSSTDSILHLMNLPIIWTDNQQINGDSIHVYPKEESVDKMRVVNNAIMIQQQDSIHYNQISGKEIVAHIKDDNLDYVEVLGNAESIFYPTDDGNMIGMNTMQSSYMTIYFLDGELERVNIFPSPKANMYPMNQIQENMLYLNNFTWQIDARPKNKLDIFNRPVRISKAELDQKKQELKEQEQAERKNKRKNRNKKKDEVKDFNKNER